MKTKYGVKWKRKEENDGAYRFDEYYNDKIVIFYNVNEAYLHYHKVLESDNDGFVSEIPEELIEINED